MVRVTVYLDSGTALALRQLARLRRRPQAEVVREVLMEYVRRARRPTPKGIGAYHSGRSDVSERARELLREAGRRNNRL